MWRFLLGWLLACCAGSVAAVELSDAERAWIQSHGPVRVLLLPTAEPFYEGSRDGRAPSGFAIEMLERVAQRAGLTLSYVSASNVPEAMVMLRQHQADLTPVMRLSQERARLLSVPGSLLPLDMVVVSRREGSQADLQGDLQGKRVAVLSGSVNDEEFSAAYPSATIERFATLREAFTAVANGRADLAPTTLQEAVYLIESQLLGNLLVRRLPSSSQAVLGPGVLLELPLLHSILAKALESITPAERAEMARRWLPVGASTVLADQAAALTPAERLWIEKHGEIRAGFDANFAPFVKAGAMGGMDGLGADILRAMANKTGLRIVAQQGGAFADVMARARRSEGVNVVVGMVRTQQRMADFLFIGPFSTVPTAMVMRASDTRRYSEPDDMPEGSVALLREHFLLPQLRLRKPGLHLLELDSQAEVLQAVADGRADAGIGNSVVVSRLLAEQFGGRLSLTGVVRGGDSELYFGVPRSQPELARVLDRGLAALTPKELAGFGQRWLFVQLEPGLQWASVLRWALPLLAALLAVLGVMAFANRRLRVAYAATQRAHSAAVAATAARGRFMAYLAHELRGSVLGISSGASLLLQPEPGVPGDKLLRAMRDSADNLHALLQTTLEHERALVQGISLQPQPCELSSWWQETLAPMQLQAQHKGLQFESTAPGPAQVLMDGQRMRQVVLNLVGNAIKFTPKGRVTVRGHWDAAERQLRIEVEDEGPGIADDEIDELFEPYAQGQAGRRAASGAGLGLAIARQIVLAMGGRIEAERGRTVGSLFRVDVQLETAA